MRRCDACQWHALVQHLPTIELTTITAPWLFAQWRIDILGPFSPASAQRRFLFVAIDYFTKWMEAEPVAQIIETKTKKFI